MPVFISLLRGINVGGNKQIKMAALKTLYESLGFTNPQTLLQSGNVVFESQQTDPLEIAPQIEQGIVQQFGFESKIILRTPDDWRAVTGQHPFTADQLAEPAKMLVIFHLTELDPGAVASLLKDYPGPEVVHCKGRELTIFYPDGMGRSKLNTVLTEKKLKNVGTARNWNTVMKLLDLAERFESS